jgi:hypothetical protein
MDQVIGKMVGFSSLSQAVIIIPSINRMDTSTSKSTNQTLGFTPSRILVEILEENVGSTNLNNIGVICRGSEDGWYEFALLSGGEWFIYKAILNNNVVSYQVLASGGISSFDYDSPHYVAGECVGDKLTIYIDAVIPKNGSVTDRSYREGQVGMFVYAREYAGVEVEVEDFTVVVP